MGGTQRRLRCVKVVCDSESRVTTLYPCRLPLTGRKALRHPNVNEGIDVVVSHVGKAQRDGRS